MIKSPVPLDEFYNEYIKCARDNGYQIVACLIARIADSPELFKEIKDNWISLDSLTEKKILFLFAGDKKAEFGKDYMMYKGEGGAGLASKNISLPQSADFKTSTLLGYDFIKNKSERYDFEENHTYEIIRLKNKLRISEKEIPCFYLTFLSNNKSIIIPLPSKCTSAYNYFKVLLGLCEEEIKLDKLLYEKLYKVLKREDKQDSIKWKSSIDSINLEFITDIMELCKKEEYQKCYKFLNKLKERPNNSLYKTHKAELQQYIDIRKAYSETQQEIIKLKQEIDNNTDKILEKCAKVMDLIKNDNKHTNDFIDILELKPNFMGFGIDIKILVDKIAKMININKA